MVIEEFGPRVANVWNHLRTTTRNLIENAWHSASSGSTPHVPRSTPYDPRADQELSQLLAALDEHAQQTESSSGREGARESRRLADACANVLSQQTQSAEVFAQLIERAAFSVTANCVAGRSLTGTPVQPISASCCSTECKVARAQISFGEGAT